MFLKPSTLYFDELRVSVEQFYRLHLRRLRYCEYLFTTYTATPTECIIVAALDPTYHKHTFLLFGLKWIAVEFVG